MVLPVMSPLGTRHPAPRTHIARTAHPPPGGSSAKNALAPSGSYERIRRAIARNRSRVRTATAAGGNAKHQRKRAIAPCAPVARARLRDTAAVCCSAPWNVNTLGPVRPGQSTGPSDGGVYRPRPAWDDLVVRPRRFPIEPTQQTLCNGAHRAADLCSMRGPLGSRHERAGQLRVGGHPGAAVVGRYG
jgi:hypothetical protein